jgi:hypothetical protein
MKAYLFYKLFKTFEWLTATFRTLAIKADPRPADDPTLEFPWDNEHQVAWDKKYQ